MAPNHFLTLIMRTPLRVTGAGSRNSGVLVAVLGGKIHMVQAVGTCGGLLTRLAKDARGNALAIMAAMLIPLIGFSGAAIDTARLYVVKVRLQQACDAGVLAGRKAMTDTSTSTALDSTASSQAQDFFKNNFRSGWFQNVTPVFTPKKGTSGSDSTVANAVNGTASVTVPLAVMQFFGAKSVTLNVSCQAIYDLADTDVMFVLDNTGSMSVTPSSGSENSASSYTRADGIKAYYRVESSGSKIDALRQAVILFDQTMTANKQTDTNVRYGFAPYSTVVSIGKLLPAGSYSSDLNYWTRQQTSTYDTTGVTKVTGVPSASCVANGRYPASGFTTGITYTTSGGTLTVGAYNGAYVTFPGSVSWSSSSNGTCSFSGNSNTAKVTRPVWTYGKYPLSVADYTALKAVPTPGRFDGSTSLWRGCVELTTVSNATSLSASNLPSDLNPDAMPDWRPMWPEAVWYQQSTSPVNDENVNKSKNYSYEALSTYEGNDSVTCPMEAQTLQQMSAAQVNSYVYGTNFKAAGNTYHDYGMSWALRMLSTKGPFASSVAPPTGRKQPTQNIVFMTDGTPVSDSDNYQMYGIEGLDKRLTGGGANEASQHSARLRVLCDAAKQRGITLYMIAFGTSLTSDMTYCASPGQSFYAKNSADLQTAFASIAKRIAMLRINQ